MANLDQYPVYFEQQVLWGEMDEFKHVNNSVYLKYFENARIKFMEESGMLQQMAAEGIGPILAKVELNFKLPLTYPDTIRTYFRVKSLGNTSMVVEHVVWSKNHNKIACYGDGVVVMLNYNDNSKTPLSDELRQQMKAYMMN
ncbi:MAG: thioesterase family protein [Chitinophagales bacterium]